MLSRKNSITFLCLLSAVLLVSGIITGLLACPEAFLSRIKWSELKSIIEHDDLAKRRVKRITCNTANYPDKGYPFLIIELSEPATVVKVESTELPFAHSLYSNGVDEYSGFPENPRIDWVFHRCADLRIDYREQIKLVHTFDVKLSMIDIIKDGRNEPLFPKHAPTLLISDPGYLTTIHQARP